MLEEKVKGKRVIVFAVLLAVGIVVTAMKTASPKAAIDMRKLLQGEEIKLNGKVSPLRLKVSPDGKHLAMLLDTEKEKQLIIISLNNGTSSELIKQSNKQKKGWYMHSFCWTPQSNSLILSRTYEDQGNLYPLKSRVSEINIVTRQSRDIGRGLIYPVCSPNGRYIAGTSWRDRSSVIDLPTIMKYADGEIIKLDTSLDQDALLVNPHQSFDWRSDSGALFCSGKYQSGRERLITLGHNSLFEIDMEKHLFEEIHRPKRIGADPRWAGDDPFFHRDRLICGYPAWAGDDLFFLQQNESLGYEVWKKSANGKAFNALGKSTLPAEDISYVYWSPTAKYCIVLQHKASYATKPSGVVYRFYLVSTEAEQLTEISIGGRFCGIEWLPDESGFIAYRDSAIQLFKRNWP